MNRHNLPLAWHAATDMSAIGWIMIAYSSNCFISQEWLASIAEGDSIINATLLYFTIKNKCNKLKHKKQRTKGKEKKKSHHLPRYTNHEVHKYSIT